MKKLIALVLLGLSSCSPEIVSKPEPTKFTYFKVVFYSNGIATDSTGTKTITTK